MADYQIAVLRDDNSDIILKKKIHIDKNILTSRIMVKKANKKAGVSKER